jgi:hypothetical protein
MMAAVTPADPSATVTTGSQKDADMKTFGLISIAAATVLALAADPAQAFTIESLGQQGSQPRVMPRDGADALQNSGAAPTARDGSNFSFSGGWGSNDSAARDRFPSFPGANNHLSLEDNNTALQYGFSPLVPRR